MVSFCHFTPTQPNKTFPIEMEFMILKLINKLQIMQAFCLIGFLCLGACAFRSDKILDAAMAGDIPALKSSLDKGWDVNMRGMHGMTPLMEAARNGHLGTCRFIIDHDGDVNSHINSGSVLTFAIASGNRELVLFLLGKGADPRWKNNQGENAYASAKSMGKIDMLHILQP